MKIKDRIIDDASPAFVVAELSANHNGKIGIALDTVKAARDAGADAIKVQHYKPESLTIDSRNHFFRINQGTVWDGLTLFELYSRACMPWEWTEQIFRTAGECGLICFSSPFDQAAVDFLETFDVPAYKIASFEITDVPLVEYAAAKQKPIIVSTGVAELDDITEAMAACGRMGNHDVALLKCTSSYPAPLESLNLNTIPDMKERFRSIVGLSDHTTGIAAPIASIALGAKIIEKHLILDRSLGGPDAVFSIEPKEFLSMTRAIRDVEKALGSVVYELAADARKSRELSRSLFVVEDVEEGGVITTSNTRSIRPGYGLHPKLLTAVLGKKVKRKVTRGTPLTWDVLE
ncbi:MAG TPA: pseudaminic acid synthase [Bacteroidota bacterium]|nr:pseudaminic acid synthase [Bacteroidota bacterium]